MTDEFGLNASVDGEKPLRLRYKRSGEGKIPIVSISGRNHYVVMTMKHPKDELGQIRSEGVAIYANSEAEAIQRARFIAKACELYAEMMNEGLIEAKDEAW